MSTIKEKKYAVMLTEGLRITDYMYDDVIQTKSTLYGVQYVQKDICTIHAYSKKDGSVLFKMDFVENFSYTEDIMYIKMNNQRCYVYFDSCQKVKGPFSKCRLDNNDVIVSNETERIVGFERVKTSLFGMFNKEGIKVLPIKYKKILPKSEEIIEVNYKNKVGLVNSEGKWIVKPIYDDIVIYNLEETLIKCWSKDDRSYALFDKEGNAIFPCMYPEIKIDDEKYLIYVHNKEQLWGIYKPNGDLVFPEVSPSIYSRYRTVVVVLNSQQLVYIPTLNLFLPRENCVHYKKHLKYYYNGKWRKLKYDKE